VSVTIPTFNREDLLKEALNSVPSQIYKNIEIIVVNDAGADVRDLISSLNRDGNIVYLEHDRNAGPSAARNTGIRAAKGEYTAYRDDDDTHYDNHILVEGLENNGYHVAYSDSYQVHLCLVGNSYVKIAKRILYSCDFDRNRLLAENYIPMINVMYTRSILEGTGLFDESLSIYEDWDFLVRLSRQSAFYHVKKLTMTRSST
jgi:glycosyltransferase involved in cell wall biosynthesis